MKKTLHKSLFVFTILLLACPVLKAQDAFGYTWLDSNDPQGPTFNWIDITSVGTEVQGLADDNSVGPFAMGMDFHFYWSDFSQIKIGSNGWLSFDNVSNIASCFPAMPTADASNNLISPLMSDLNFANGSPGKIYTYHDATPGDEKFIISYIGTTFWTQANPTFGSNTFQVILSNADSSITFQYGVMENDFPYNCATGKVVGGIENLTGEIGLEIFNGTMPFSNYAVKFYYPQTITLSIIDVAPTANQNAGNEGVFVLPDEIANFSATISNTGNTDIVTATTVAAVIRPFAGAPVYNNTQTVPSLAVGASQVVDFAPVNVDWDPGTYYFEVLAANTSDINPNNDLNVTEINVLDLSAETVSLGYVIGQNAAATIQWAGGGDGTGGGGIEIEPPFYPAVVTGFEVGIAAGSTDAFTMRLFDDDGPNGGPGTELASTTIPAGFYTPGAFTALEFDDPVTITDGSFYLGWYMEGNAVGLLVEAEGPIANRTYEILSNSWSKYRTVADAMLRAVVQNPFFVATEDVIKDSQLRVYPNPNNGTFHIDNTLGEQNIKNIRILNTLGAVVFELSQNVAAGQQLNISTDLPTGLYYLELKTTDERRIIRKVMVD